jgi:hypothetical protein
VFTCTSEEAATSVTQFASDNAIRGLSACRTAAAPAHPLAAVLSFAATHHAKVGRGRLAVAGRADLLEQLDGSGEVPIPHGVGREDDFTEPIGDPGSSDALLVRSA